MLSTLYLSSHVTSEFHDKYFGQQIPKYIYLYLNIFIFEKL